LVMYGTGQLSHTHCRSLFVRAAAHRPRLRQAREPSEN
jgi:hypothetical protein